MTSGKPPKGKVVEVDFGNPKPSRQSASGMIASVYDLKDKVIPIVRGGDFHESTGLKGDALSWAVYFAALINGGYQDGIRGSLKELVDDRRERMWSIPGSTSSAQRRLPELEKAGFIAIERSRHGLVIYFKDKLVQCASEYKKKYNVWAKKMGAELIT